MSEGAIPPTSFFRIFRTPDGRWSWSLVRSDLEGPLARGQTFGTREDAIANTILLREAVEDAGWAADRSDGDDRTSTDRARAPWADTFPTRRCSWPGCLDEATAVAEGGLLVRGGVERAKRAWCEPHAEKVLGWEHMRGEADTIVTDIVGNDGVHTRRGLLRRRAR